MKASQSEVQLIVCLASQPPDPVAQSELFGLFYEPLIDRLKKEFPKVADDDICETAFQALDNLSKSPQKFDPEKRTLLGYLVMDGKGDLINLLKKRSKERKATILVEDWDAHRNIKTEEERDQELENQVLTLIEAKLRDLFVNETDIAVARMIEMGIRDTGEYAKLLGLEDSTPEEQRKIVKQHKDRIKKQLDRNGWDVFVKQIRDKYL